MKKQLIPIGNGWSIYMPSNILKLMGVDPKKSFVVFEIEEKVLNVIETKENPEECNNRLIRKFIRSGHGYALYIPNTILELLEINPETDSVNLEINKTVLKVKKI